MPQVLLFAVANCNHLRPRGPKPRALKTELRSVKMVSAGRLALPFPRFRTEHVAATPRAETPSEDFSGIVGVGNRAAENLGTRHRGKIEIGGPEGSGLPKPYKMDAPNVAVRYREL